MQATSLASAGEPRPTGEVLPLKVARLRRLSPGALWPEALRRLAWRAFVPLLHGLRTRWIYRLTLHGMMTDRFAFQPDDPRPRHLDDADAFMRGRLRLAGQTVEFSQGSIFDHPMPSPEFAVAIHGFDWLRHLEAAGGDLSRIFALTLTKHWLKRNARYALPAWRPEIIAERLFNLFAHGRFFLANSDLVWRSKLFVSLRDQCCVLARTVDEASDGLPRLQAAATLALSGFCLEDRHNATLGLRLLAVELDRQILPDGGHISRSPEALLEAFRLLSAVQHGLEHARHETHMGLRSALDRITHMLRFFRMGDGTLPVFNGGAQGDATVLAALLPEDVAEARPLAHAPHSGYQRLAGGRTVILLDAGCPPPSTHSSDAHAGCLSFEMTSGEQRVIVNCGAAIGRDKDWEIALRATAAHSALTIDDTSQAMVLPGGRIARILGPRLLGGATTVETRRTQGAHGLSVDATEDSYVPRFGLMHQRRMLLAPRGTALTGSDRLAPVESRTWTRTLRRHGTAEGVPFTIRFHIHPDVRLSLAQARGSVILKLPNGEGWRFRCGGGTLSIEESIYFGGGFPRRAEQLVINGRVADKGAEIAWMFEQVGSA
jgi:uncharacterized heparinase superfamily protein